MNHTFSFPGLKITEVVNDVPISVPSLVLRDKGLTSIIGRSGVGKSTILRSIFSSLSSGGSLSPGFAPEQNSHASEKYIQRYRRVFYLPQDVGLLSEPLHVNVALKRCVSEKEHLRIRQLLHSLRLNSELLETRLSPADYSSELSPLSGGEKKRIGIARSLFSSACYILLDEPTSGIDEMQESDIISLLLRECHDKSIVVVTHSAKLVQRSSQVFEIH